MSTIIIQKQNEKNLKLNGSEEKHENATQNPFIPKWTEIAGLSWILLEKEDEY